MRPAPPSPAPERSVWRTGCLVGGTFAMIVLALTCGAAWFVGRGYLGEILLTHFVADAVSRQASALGRDPPDYAAACRENSATLEAATPCAVYIGWILRTAPYFPGATVSVQRIDFDSLRGEAVRVGLPMTVSGPRGNGRLRFTLVYIDGRLQIDAVRPW
ncbi:MAG: hypothetical protein WCJ30_11510 [Deltaproteobacteria bacterium]